ncbi:MAG: tetratricopeptide repeat protein [Anaerovoracaceae bacterium]|jgi:hypothetical protein
MSRETEKILSEFEKFISDKELNSDEDCEEAVNEFMKNMLIGSLNESEKKGEDAWDYLDMAYESDNEEDALTYAKKALKLDKNCLDAEVMVAELTTETKEELKRKYEKLIVKAEKHLKEERIWADENIGIFWGIHETRPYMRLRHSFMHLLLEMGKYKKAIKECEDLLVLSEGDNLGVRYILISLYAFFEDEINAMKLYNKFNKEESAHMLLPITALYYKLDNYKKAETFLKKLDEANDSLEEFFGNYGNVMDDPEVEEAFNLGMYRPGSKEELVLAVLDSAFLYTTNEGFLRWISNHYSS